MSAPPQPEPTDDRPATTLRVQQLDVSVGGTDRRAVQGVSLEIGRGEAVGLVGESGSGKTLTCRSVLGLLPPHVGESGMTPLQRKVSVATTSSAPPMACAEVTAMLGSTLLQMCLRRVHHCVAPISSAASTYWVRRRPRAAARETR